MKFRAGLFLFSFAAALGGLVSIAAAQPANIHDAKLTSVAVAPGELSGVIAHAVSSGNVRWIGWSAPSIEPKSQMCCFESLDRMTTGPDGRACCGRCSLEDHGGSFMNRDEKRIVELEAPAEFLILLRVEEGRVDRVRLFSYDCEIDAGGRAVTWLAGVRPDDSVAYLETLVARAVAEGEGRREHSADGAISAIALEPGAAADRALERLIAPQSPSYIRKKVAFWLGNSRGRSGYEILKAAVARDSADREFRKHATFAFSQSPVPEALTTLLDMAKRDPDAGVRGQALFWLAQKAGRKAAGAIDEAIENDPDTEVKKKAVFALTQMPKDEGVPQLIRVARTNHNSAVRKQAMFWLGQSNDPRAIAFIEEVLTK